MEDRKYYLGLDIGTDSVGFAVTDPEYHLIRKGGKHLWGSRLFDEAQDASTRRAARAARRRYQRRRARILLLRDLFREEMDKVDPLFFKRLDASKFHPEDKMPELRAKHFYTDDLSFYKSYKTIYHLRKALMSEDRKFDIRLVYLAIAHMIKYRGNFLREGSISTGGVAKEEIEEAFDEIDEILSSLAVEDEDGESEVESFSMREKPGAAEKLIDLFKGDQRISDRTESVSGILLRGKGRGTKAAIVSFISGGKRKLSDFFPRLKDDDPEKAKTSISFEMEDFDDAILQYGLSDEETSLLSKAKELADSLLLVNLLKGKNSITDAMLSVYEAYGQDLKALRRLTKALRDRGMMKKDGKNIYNDFWDGTTGVTFLTFTGSSGHKDGKTCEKKCSPDDFMKAVNALCDKAAGIEELAPTVAYLRGRIGAGKFFERQNSKHNGVFPYQLNESELAIILQKQGKYYPFLLEKDKGFPNPKKEDYKILSLLRYRIPYYVGPISNPEEGRENKNHWVVKNDPNTKITPWNFFDVVNRSATAKGFMDNLRNTCTYIKGEETLPKSSMVFQAFKVLNELNNISLNHRPLSFEEKRHLLKDVYLKKKKVKPSDLKKSLSLLYADKAVVLSTRNTDDEEKLENMLNGSLSSWIALESVLGEGFYRNREAFELGEKIIAIVTAFEDKATRMEELSSLLSPEQAQKASSLPFKDYAPVSDLLLRGIKENVVNRETGEIIPSSIMDLLYRTNDNFMEIYEGDKYSFSPQVEAINSSRFKEGGESDPLRELIDEAYVSPGMKRSLFQTFHIVDELKKILGIKKFDKVFVECTRSKAKDPKTTESRKKSIEKYLSAAVGILKSEAAALKKELDDKSEDQLRSKRLYLYFMQLGHDVYTGEEIKLERLSSDYDIDHIIPQAYVKDDSFLNTVLTKRSKNNLKDKEYPLHPGFISPEGKKWIEILSQIKVGNRKLMPGEKRERLLRKEELRDGEIVGFVNRQLVYTNQAVKAVCDIFKLRYPETEVIYSKAGLVTDFRGMFHLPKVRDLNDFHHANDAYLNIVVGDVYNQRFGRRINKKWVEEQKAKGHPSFKAGPKWIFRRDQKSRDLRKVIWVACDYVKKDDKTVEVEKENSTIKLVRKTLSWNDPMVTFRPNYLSGKSGFFNKIGYVRGKDSKETNFPLKKVPDGVEPVEWMKKYGSYSAMITPFYCLVKSQKKRKQIYSLEGIPEILWRSFKTNELKREAEKYLANNGLINPEILIQQVPIRTIVILPTKNGSGTVRLAISGRSDNSIIAINATEPLLDEPHKNYFKSICKILGKGNPAFTKKDTSIYDENDGVHIEKIMEGEAEVTRAGNIEFLNYLTSNVLTNGCFANLPEVGNSIAKIASGTAKFLGLSTLDQLNAIYDVVSIIGCRSVNVNLRNWFGDSVSKEAGKIRFNKELPARSKLVRTSYTGYYENLLFEVPED